MHSRPGPPARVLVGRFVKEAQLDTNNARRRDPGSHQNRFAYLKFALSKIVLVYSRRIYSNRAFISGSAFLGLEANSGLPPEEKRFVIHCN